MQVEHYGPMLGQENKPLRKQRSYKENWDLHTGDMESVYDFDKYKNKTNRSSLDMCDESKKQKNSKKNDKRKK